MHLPAQQGKKANLGSGKRLGMQQLELLLGSIVEDEQIEILLVLKILVDAALGDAGPRDDPRERCNAIGMLGKFSQGEINNDLAFCGWEIAKCRFWNGCSYVTTQSYDRMVTS